jgi:hypothetical protein
MTIGREDTQGPRRDSIAHEHDSEPSRLRGSRGATFLRRVLQPGVETRTESGNEHGTGEPRWTREMISVGVPPSRGRDSG